MGKDAFDVLDSAEGFKSFTLTPDAGGDRVSVGIFYWFSGSNARQFQLSFDAAAREEINQGVPRPFSSDYTVIADNNVLIILDSRSMSNRNTIKSHYY
jgi:hypothetical protein